MSTIETWVENSSNSQNTYFSTYLTTVPSATAIPSGFHQSLEADLDELVVVSAAAFVSAMRESGTSDEVADQGRELYNSLRDVFEDVVRYRHYMHHRDERAQILIDAMQSLLDNGFVEPQSKIIFSGALSGLVRVSGLYPQRFILHNVTRHGRTRAEGPSGGIEKGFFSGRAVCIRIPKYRADLGMSHWALSREIVPWAQLSHENVLPFLGIYPLNDQYNRLGVVSPFCENGNVIRFLERNPDTNRQSLIYGVASGMSYLHHNRLVHGNIKGSNILVTDTVPPHACLADFGCTPATDIKDLDSAYLLPDASKEQTVEFEAPELSIRKPHRSTMASDVYAFSMVSYQLLTGFVDFSRWYKDSIKKFATEGKRPLRPVGLDDFMWRLLEDCWAQNPGRRPGADQILERLEEIENGDKRVVVDKRKKVTKLLSTIFGNKDYYRRLLSCNDDNAQQMLDAFQLLLDTDEIFRDRTQLIAAIRRISERTERYPSRFYLDDPSSTAEATPTASGSFADIYKIDFQGEQTCFKVIRRYSPSEVEYLRKVYAREAILWAQLSHQNILPFYGLSKFGVRLSFVSRWATNGHLNDYLAQNPDANRILLCSDTAAGVEYLHRNNIIHGDLKGCNVLIDSSGRAALGDFGLSSVTDPQIISWTSQSTMASRGGTTRWQAPELLQPISNQTQSVPNSKASDVFAWAHVCYETFTRRCPFFEIPNSKTGAIIRKITRGEIPTRPQQNEPPWLEHGLNEQIWGLMMDCWKLQPQERPNIAAVIERLNKEKPPDFRPPGEWEKNTSMRFRNRNAQNNLSTDTLIFWEGLESLITRVIIGF